MTENGRTSITPPLPTGGERGEDDEDAHSERSLGSKISSSIMGPSRTTSMRRAMQYSPGRKPRKPRTVLEAIDQLLGKTIEFEQQGSIPDALEYHWRILEMKREYFGPEAHETNQTLLKITDLNNKLAQDLISKNRLGEANKYLAANDGFTSKTLEDPVQNAQRLVLRCHLFNNLTCMRKCQGNVRAALKYTEKALSIMLNLNMLDHLPTCYLNIGALYSSLGLHAEALKHSYLALQILKELARVGDQINQPLPGEPPLSPEAEVIRNSSVSFTDPLGESGMDPRQQRADPAWKTAVSTQLAITYFNIAVEQEYLKDFPACLDTYQVAIRTVQDLLSEENPLMAKFQAAFKKAQKDNAKRMKALTRAANANTSAHPNISNINTSSSSVSPPNVSAISDNAPLSPTYTMNLNALYATHARKFGPARNRGARGGQARGGGGGGGRKLAPLKNAPSIQQQQSSVPSFPSGSQPMGQQYLQSQPQQQDRALPMIYMSV